jgi:hypothetical protein
MAIAIAAFVALLKNGTRIAGVSLLNAISRITERPFYRPQAEMFDPWALSNTLNRIGTNTFM